MQADLVRSKFLLSKIIHWIIFEDSLCLQSALETLFTCKRVSNFRKYAYTDKAPHSAECVKGLCPFETHHLLEKVDENFLFAFGALVFVQTKNPRLPDSILSENRDKSFLLWCHPNWFC